MQCRSTSTKNAMMNWFSSECLRKSYPTWLQKMMMSLKGVWNNAELNCSKNLLLLNCLNSYGHMIQMYYWKRYLKWQTKVIIYKVWSQTWFNGRQESYIHRIHLQTLAKPTHVIAKYNTIQCNSNNKWIRARLGVLFLSSWSRSNVFHIIGQRRVARLNVSTVWGRILDAIGDCYQKETF